MRNRALIGLAAASVVCALAASAGNDTIYGGEGPTSLPTRGPKGPGKGHKQKLRKIKPKGGPKRKSKCRPARIRG